MHTVYVPADRYTARPAAALGRGRRPPGGRAGWLGGAVPLGRGPEHLVAAVAAAGRGQAGRRADRGPAAGLRGRLRPAARRRSRTPMPSRSPNAWPTRSPPGPPRPSWAAVQVLRGADPAPWAADPRSVPDHAAGAFGATCPDSLVITFPKVSTVSQVEAMVAACEAYETRRRPAGRPPRLRDPGRDAAADPGRRRHRSGRRGDPRRGRPGHLAALRHVRLQRLAAGVRGVPVDGAPGRRLRQGRHAGRRRRHRGAPVRRLHQHPPGRHRRADPGGLATAPPAGPAVAGAGYLPGLGPAPGPAADPLHRQHRLLP